jgi:hypothetical protein
MVASSLHRGEVTGDEVPERYHDVVRPHVESFDYFIGEGLKKVTAALEPHRVRLRAAPEPIQMHTIHQQIQACYRYGPLRFIMNRSASLGAVAHRTARIALLSAFTGVLSPAVHPIHHVNLSVCGCRLCTAEASCRWPSAAMLLPAVDQ